MPPDTCRGIAPASPTQRAIDLGAQRAVARALEIDHVDEVGVRGDDSRDELLEGLAKEDAVVVALFEAYGVVAQEVDGGDQLHSSVLAR